MTVSSLNLRSLVSDGETRTSRTLPFLPPEIHLEMIDIIGRRVPRTPCLEESCYDPVDLSTLLNCSRVCKLWLNTARIGIWASVRLNGGKKTAAFVELLHAYTRVPGDAAPALAIPNLGRYVSHLSVRETRGNAWDPKWLDEALPQLAVHLPRVQSLEMERVTWEYLSCRSRTACVEAFKHAKTLALRGFVFHTTRDMYNFVGEFAELEALTLDGVHCTKTWVGEGTAARLAPRRLKEVGVRNVPIEAVLEWMMTAGAKGIRSIRMGGVGVSEANVVGRFLRGVGDSLKKVCIGFDSEFMERGDALVKEMALSENRNLEEFHIFGLVVPSPPPVDPFREPGPPQRALEALTTLLGQIESRMRVLSLALYPADLRAMCAVDFEGLAGVFGREVWAGVDEVRVVVANKGEYGLGEVVRERLGVLCSRGVLQVNVGFDEREIV